MKKLRISRPKIPGGQHRFKGIGLNLAEEALFFKVNEIIIEHIRKK